jgi:hypothetical protein
MGEFGVKSIYVEVAEYFAFAACSKSGCGEIEPDNAYRPVQNKSSKLI